MLLGGDTDVIPARFGYVTFYTGDFIPTDMYYSCLDGTWNADGDSLWGEAYHSATDPGRRLRPLRGGVPRENAGVDARRSERARRTRRSTTRRPTDTASKGKFLMLAEVVFPSDYHPGDQIILDGAEIAESVYRLLSRRAIPT